jgi:protein-S-isoprenylcysteine O-methyltransferase Ste14
MTNQLPSTSPKSRFRTSKILWEAIIGAIIGASLVRHGKAAFIHSLLRIAPPMRASLILWLIFSVYWSIAARDSASTQSSESKFSRAFHVLWVNGALLLLILPVPGLTHRFIPENKILIAVGLLIQATFLLLAVWARRHLGSNWAGEVRIAQGHQLVRSGPYHFVRHPIYTAVLGMYIGTALVSGQIHAPIALVLVTLAYWRKIRMEEEILAQTFGSDWTAYRSSTYALIPPLF